MLGFVLADDAAASAFEEQLLKARSDKVGGYFAARDQMKRALEKLGIEPLAFLPTNAWHKICADSGLFRLNAGDSSQIALSTVSVGQVAGRARMNTALALTALALAVWTLVFAMFSSNGMRSWPASGLSLLAAVGALWLCSGQVSTFFLRRSVRSFLRRPWQEVLMSFFPGGKSCAFSQDALNAELVLPEPPEQVAAILLKAKSLPLQVAAVAEAISFAETPESMLLHAASARIERQRHELAENVLRRVFDPIVYYEHKGVVAIIAQFGDFPIEKEAVDRALFAENLF
jgi:hypothetical protein